MGGPKYFLPLISHSNPGSSSSSSRIKQRCKRRDVSINLANDAIKTLNFLASQTPSSSSQNFCSDPAYSFHEHPDVTPDALSVRAVRQIHQSTTDFVTRLAPFYQDSGQCGDLLNTDPVDIAVSGASSPAAVPLVSSKVSLPTDLRKVHLIDILPPDLVAIYEKENPSLLLPPDQIAKARKAMLVSSQDDYIDLVVRLSDLGMVEFHRHPKAFNGVFGLPKPNGAQRFLVDARPANALFVEPAKVQLCSPDVLAGLQVPPGATVYAAKSDVSDFYHRLLLPGWLVPYFALPGVPAGKVGLGAEYGENTVIYPCCTTLPMGWSHSPLLAQAAHEHILNTRTSLQPEDRMGRPGVDLRLNRTMHGVYLDDAWLLGTDPAQVGRFQDEYLAVMDSLLLVINPKKTVRPTADGCEIIGVEFHGRRLTLGLHPQKVATLIRKTRAVLSGDYCTGKALSSLVGSWSWGFLARRPLFSLFSSVYRFIEAADFRLFQIWPSVRRELTMAISLAPLMFTKLDAPWFASVFAVDASSSGQGVVMGRLDPQVQAMIATLPLPSEAELEDPCPHPSTVGIGWKEVVVSKWARPEHINLLEATALKSSLRRAASSPQSVGSRLLVWSDSLVVTCAVRKGRSSSYALLCRLRSIAAISLALGFYVHINWIPTDFNPADEPSRRFQHKNRSHRLFGSEYSSDDEGDGPPDRFLNEASVSAPSRRIYSNGLAMFYRWLAKYKGVLPSTVAQLDRDLADFAHYLFRKKKGKCRGYVEAAKAGVAFVLPQARQNLPVTSQALLGWKRLVPPEPRPPMTWKVALVVAYTMATMGDLDFAIGSLLAFEGYLRVGELVDLQVADVVFPGNREMGVGSTDVQLHLRETKTGPNKWAVVKHPFVATLLRLQTKDRTAGFLFDFTEAQFRLKFKQVCVHLGLRGGFVPHSLRHGKATHDFLSGVPLETILILGRWAAHKSARLYVQSGRAQLLAGKTPDWVAAFAERLASNLCAHFALAHEALSEALSGCGL